MEKKKVKVLVMLNAIRHGTDPYYVTGAIDDDRINITIGSFLNSQDELREFEIPNKILIGFNGKGRLDITAWLRVFRFLKSYDADIIHTNHTMTGIVCRLFAKVLGTKATIHVMPIHLMHYTIPERIINAFLSLITTRTVLVGKSVYDSYCFLEKLMVGKRYRIINNGLDIDKVEKRQLGKNLLRDRLSLQQEDFVIITVARLVPFKKQNVIVEAISKALETFPNIKYVMIGDGPCKEDLMNLVANKGIQERVLFTGLIPQEKVFDYMWASDLYVMASEMEGLCVAFLQAMAAGLPSVVSDIPSFLELVRDGERGRVFPLNNSQILAEIIVEAVSNPIKFRTYGENARKEIKENFSIKKTARRYADLYLELLK